MLMKRGLNHWSVSIKPSRHEISVAHHQIGWWPNEQTPIRCGFGDDTAPDLDDPRCGAQSDERRRKPLAVVGCNFVELLSEPWELRCLNRMPCAALVRGPI